MSPQPVSVRTVHVVGIGAGDPRHLTLQAVDALREVDVFLVADKEADGSRDARGLLETRTSVLAAHLPPGSYRVVRVPDPPRGDGERRDPAGGGRRADRG